MYVYTVNIYVCIIGVLFLCLNLMLSMWINAYCAVDDATELLLSLKLLYIIAEKNALRN